MSTNDSLRPGEQELERHLKQLTPAGHRIDRDALMFTAGRLAGERVRRSSLQAWRSLSAALLFMLLGLGWLHFEGETADGNLIASSDPTGSVSEPLAVLEAPLRTSEVVAPLSRGAAESPFLRLRHGLIVLGPEALPAPRSGASLDEIRSVADWLHQRSAAQM